MPKNVRMPRTTIKRLFAIPHNFLKCPQIGGFLIPFRHLKCDFSQQTSYILQVTQTEPIVKTLLNFTVPEMNAGLFSENVRFGVILTQNRPKQDAI